VWVGGVKVPSSVAQCGMEDASLNLWVLVGYSFGVGTRADMGKERQLFPRLFTSRKVWEPRPWPSVSHNTLHAYPKDKRAGQVFSSPAAKCKHLVQAGGTRRHWNGPAAKSTDVTWRSQMCNRKRSRCPLSSLLLTGLAAVASTLDSQGRIVGHLFPHWTLPSSFLNLETLCSLSMAPWYSVDCI
jgi:hypothetical protein